MGMSKILRNFHSRVGQLSLCYYRFNLAFFCKYNRKRFCITDRNRHGKIFFLWLFLSVVNLIDSLLRYGVHETCLIGAKLNRIIQNLFVPLKNILRECLQYKILDIIFSSPYANWFAFMGGTAIRIIHGQNRFSEDLDFDNFGLSGEAFENLSRIIQRQITREGYQVAIRNVIMTAYHCHVNIQQLLYEQHQTGNREEKLVIRIDTEPQNFNYNPDKFILNKFDIFTRINVVPIDLLLAQKLFAILNRKRVMGRDFFDSIFLFVKTRPNFSYLNQTANIKTMPELKAKLFEKCEKIQFESLVQDIEPFIVNPDDTKRVLLFKEYIQKLN